LDKIIGRQKEQEALQKIIDSQETAFVALSGRYRVGKTYLIRNFFKNKGVFFHLTGVAEASMEAQLNNFVREFSHVFKKGKSVERPGNWFDAFYLLYKEVEKVPKGTKIILFFDELPWLTSPHSNFLQALGYLWNRYFTDVDDLILIISSSSVSWMVDHVINDTGGLHGRITKEMRLLPFTLGEAGQ
jgi:AAA+ ATPase superfamily predicted ATPase